MKSWRCRPATTGTPASAAPARARRRRVLDRLGVGVFGALLAIPFVISPGLAASASYVANCDVRLRTTTSTSATVVDVVASGSTVTASGTVSGGSWSADCPSTVSGASWLAITAVNGTSTSTLYGKATVYAATGLFSLAPAPPPPPPPTDVLEGVDVATYQGSINYAQVRASGRAFVIAKATEGIGYLDPRWTTNRANAPAAGLALGGYHYARPDLNSTLAGARSEADWFASQLNLAGGMLIPALDLEVHGTLGVASLTAWVQNWLAEVYTRTGDRPMIYVSPSFWRTYLGDTRWFADNGYKILWVAHWTSSSSPSVPGSNWGGRGWTFWQYTSSGSVPGIAGSVDLDRYNGTDLTRVIHGADFAVSLGGGGTGSVEQGASISIPIAITRKWFTLPVSVAVSGLPSGLSPALGTASTLGGTTSVSFSPTTSVPAGAYPYTVTATSNGLVRTATGTVTVTDARPPTLKGPTTALVGGHLGWTVPAATSWSASDPSGVASYGAMVKTNGGAWSSLALSAPTATSVSQGLHVGSTYAYAAQATDTVGNASGYAIGPVIKPLLDQQTVIGTSYSSGWTTAKSTTVSGGSLRYATRAGAWASYRFSGRSIAWVAYRGPTRGKADVYVDGTLRGTVNLYASTYIAQPIVFVANWAASGTHTLKIVVKGTAGHPRVDVDAFIRLVSA
jgi:GH25 family lysozyme M1 (1,4-beta-N-acetylmuramidase)